MGQIISCQSHSYRTFQNLFWSLYRWRKITLRSVRLSCSGLDTLCFRCRSDGNISLPAWDGQLDSCGRAGSNSFETFPILSTLPRYIQFRFLIDSLYPKLQDDWYIFEQVWHLEKFEKFWFYEFIKYSIIF